MSGRELENRFPATSFISLNWFLEGSVELQSTEPGVPSRVLPQRLIIGKVGPTKTISRGDIRYFGVAMYPDAFAAVFGVAPGSLDGKFIDTCEILTPPALAMCEAVADADSDGQRSAILEGFLAEHVGTFRVSLWSSALRAGSQLSVTLLSRMLALGRRQTIRTTQKALGVGVVDLKRFARGTKAFAELGERLEKDEKVSLSDIAARAGYADQAHLTRDSRTVTGRSPGAFLREFETEEADWVYRASLTKPERGTPPGKP